MTTLATRSTWVLVRYRRIIGEGAWVAAGQISTAVVLLVGTRLITEFVPPDTWGLFTMILGLLMLARNVLVTPVLQAVIQFYAQSVASQQLAVMRRIVTRWTVHMTLVLAGLSLLGSVGAWPFTGISPAIVGLAVLISALDILRVLELNFLQAARRQKPHAIASALEAWLRIGLMVGLAWWWGPELSNLLIGNLAAVLIGYLALLMWVPREGTESVGLDRPQHTNLADEMLRYALPLAPLALIGWITSLSDRYIIGWMLGAAEVGVYALIYGLIGQPFAMSQMIIARTLSPVYYKAVSTHDNGLEIRIFRIWIAGTIAIGTLGVLAILLLKDTLAGLLLAEQYRHGAELMPWIAAGWALAALSSVYEAKLHAYRRTRLILSLGAISAVVSVVLPIALIPLMGLKGAAVACPIYFGFSCLILAVTALRSQRYPPVL